MPTRDDGSLLFIHPTTACEILAGLIFWSRSAAGEFDEKEIDTQFRATGHWARTELAGIAIRVSICAVMLPAKLSSSEYRLQPYIDLTRIIREPVVDMVLARFLREVHLDRSPFL